VQQEEAERNAEKRRREQAKEVVDDSEEEDEELPQEWAWSPRKEKRKKEWASLRGNCNRGRLGP
jgi:hypothetical protein